MERRDLKQPQKGAAMRSKITFSMVLICLFAITAFGQTVKLENGRLSPRLLNYQGYLTDTLGNPITNPSVTMTFTIFDAISAGNQKWTETQGTVSIEKGIFHVLLGSVAAIPDSVFTNSSDRWLELSVTGQTLTPRTQIVSVPYAYTATYSDTALYARNSAPDFDWNFLISDGADTTLQAGGRWGLARPGNMLFGNADSTHVNFGVACTTGTNLLNFKYCTVAGGSYNAARGSYSTVSGGYRSIAGNYATVAGGSSNFANDYSNVGGGGYDTVLGTWATIGGGANNKASGNHVVVAGGWWNNASALSATVGGGNYNTASGEAATVGGGSYNIAGNSGSVVGGGYGNTVSGNYSVAAGGYYNSISGMYSFVGGGDNNAASGAWSTIAGGSSNMSNEFMTIVAGGYCDTVKAVYGGILSGYSNLAGDAAADTAATICGGYENTAIGKYSFIGGGQYDTATGGYSTVGGGYLNTASANYACIPGGFHNVASGQGSFVAGYENSAANYANVGGGSYNAAIASNAVVGGGSRNVASNVCATVGGGQNDTASGQSSTVAGGINNRASAVGSFVGGGGYNASIGTYSTVGGGYADTAGGYASTVFGGYSNNSAANYSTVAGGQNNTAAQTYAFVGGGNSNAVNGPSGTVAGGAMDTVTGSYGFATNYHTRVLTGHDNSSAFTTSHTTAANQIRAASFSTGVLEFAMDHPKDPMNKILNQYAVGSDEAILMYTGTAVIAANGKVKVGLPDYFSDISQNPRIQLTGVGGPDVVYVAEDITGNSFVIGGKSGMKVYWTVTAERKDVQARIAYAKTPVVQEKTGDLRGHSLDDDALIGIYDGLQKDHQGEFSFKTEEGRQANEQIKHPPQTPEQGNK